MTQKTLRQRQAENGRTLSLNGAKWRKLRKSVLARDPLCRHCWTRGLRVIAVHVDHINNDPSDNRMSNLQGLCPSCHSRKTQADMGKRVRYGCDVNGMPTDPSHPWNNGR
jgi:5-methylcytosine-specific restriction endonuclease McrA